MKKPIANQVYTYCIMFSFINDKLLTENYQTVKSTEKTHYPNKQKFTTPMYKNTQQRGVGLLPNRSKSVLQCAR